MGLEPLQVPMKAGTLRAEEPLDSWRMRLETKKKESTLFSPKGRALECTSVIVTKKPHEVLLPMYYKFWRQRLGEKWSFFFI